MLRTEKNMVKRTLVAQEIPKLIYFLHEIRKVLYTAREILSIVKRQPQI